MAKATINGDRQLLVYLTKVLTAKTAGKTLGDRIREEEPLPVGKHDVSGTIQFSLTANVSEDCETDRFKGVGLDEVLTWIMATVPGFMEDKLRKAAAIVIEIKRAEMEGRKIKATTWTDENGKVHKILVREIKAEQARVQAWKERAQETMAPFAKVIKETVTAKGRVSVSNVDVKVTTDEGQQKPTVPVVRVSSVTAK